MENRQNRRYRLAAGVRFFWKPFDGEGGEGEGLTRDISVSSAYILTRSRLPLGTIVQMIVALPAIHEGLRGPQMFIKGRTVRSDASGIAVIGDMGFHLEFPHSQQNESAAPRESAKAKEDALVFFPGLRTPAS